MPIGVNVDIQTGQELVLALQTAHVAGMMKIMMISNN
jgi:hypothetical protein